MPGPSNKANNTTTVLNLVQGLWGGVGQYAHFIACMPKPSGLSIRTIVIDAPHWPKHQKLFDNSINEVVRITSRYDLSWIHKIREDIELHKPDYLFVHGFNGPILAMILRRKLSYTIPILCSYHGGYNAPTFLKRIIAPFVNLVLYKIYAFYAHKIVTVSNFSRKNLIDRKVPSKKIKVIHNGLKTEYAPKTNQDSLRQEWMVPQGAFIIGWAGRLTPEKGVEILLKSFSQFQKKHENCHLVLAGEGNLKESLLSVANKCEIINRTHFLGAVEDIDSFLNGIHVFVLPSLHENHSIALLEAMRASKAIIATDVGGNSESIRHEFEGLLVPSSDTRSLSQAIERLANNKDLRLELGIAARKRFISKFSYETMVNELSSWLTAYD